MSVLDMFNFIVPPVFAGVVVVLPVVVLLPSSLPLLPPQAARIMSPAPKANAAAERRMRRFPGSCAIRSRPSLRVHALCWV
jgi:hypothetical protein